MVWFVNLFNISMQLSYVWTANPERPSTTGKLLGMGLTTLHCELAIGHMHGEVTQANRGATNSQVSFHLPTPPLSMAC